MWYHTNWFIAPKKFGYSIEESQTKEGSFTITGEDRVKEGNFGFSGEKKKE